MLRRRHCVLGICLAWAVASARADLIVDYIHDAGGSSSAPLNGLAARATFRVDGTEFSILLENTSAGVPDGFEVSDSLLVSIGLNLPEGVWIAQGNAAVIGPGSMGLGSWSSRTAGDSVGEQWIWTNDFGGDLMEGYAQVISTSAGQGGGTATRFDGGSGTVGGPFGGIAANPPLLQVPGGQPAASNAIWFDLTLNAALSEAELVTVAHGSIVEFGSDARYLVPAPEPGSLFALLLGIAVVPRRWQRAAPAA
jgi:hypothetical protein